MDKEKGLVVHISLSEEGKKEAQRIAKEIADRLDALKHAFIQMGGVNITPHTDRPPKPLDHWMKVNPVIVKTKRHGTLMTPEAAVQDAMMKPSPIQDELIDWLKEQDKHQKLMKIIMQRRR